MELSQWRTGAQGPKPPIPCSTIVPEQTAYSGVSPGAEMSTPSSGDQLPGGAAAPFGSGNTKPPVLGAGAGAAMAGELPEPPAAGAWACCDAAAAARAAAAACAASAWLSWLLRLATRPCALASCAAFT